MAVVGRRLGLCACCAAASTLVGSCGSPSPAAEETEPSCLPAPVDLNCDPAYGLAADGVTIAPTFQQVFDVTLAHCNATAGCHRAPNPPHGFQLSPIDTAYQSLTTKNAQGEDHVIPGNVKCGKVLVRLESVDEPWSMPPGSGAHLSDAELCSFAHWVANGAPR